MGSRDWLRLTPRLTAQEASATAVDIRRGSTFVFSDWPDRRIQEQSRRGYLTGRVWGRSSLQVAVSGHWKRCDLLHQSRRQSSKSVLHSQPERGMQFCCALHPSQRSRPPEAGLFTFRMVQFRASRSGLPRFTLNRFSGQVSFLTRVRTRAGRGGPGRDSLEIDPAPCRQLSPLRR